MNEAVQTFERPENGINPAIVGDIVTEVMHRRGINRRNPDRIDAEPDEIVEPLPNAIEIANAVAVRVLKRSRVDLIKRTGLPPVMHDAALCWGQIPIMPRLHIHPF
jgi:hypothetical protein